MTDVSGQHSLTSFLDRDLETIETTYYDAWSSELEIYLQASKLYLYALCFVNEQALTPKSPNRRTKVSTQSQFVLQKGLTSASRLIGVFANLHNSTTSLPTSITQSVHARNCSSHLLFYPKSYFTNIYFATVFLLRYLGKSLLLLVFSFPGLDYCVSLFL